MSLFVIFQSLLQGDMVIATALAIRGTDIPVAEDVNELKDGGGGLHVLLTYLPKNSRVERQIMGRTGRKGLPGSTRTILCTEKLVEEIGVFEKCKEKIYEKRDFIEAHRVEGLKESLDVIVFREELFQIFCSKLNEELEVNFTGSKHFGKDKLSKGNRKRLLEELKEKKCNLDLLPCKDVLKESWAIWLSQNSTKFDDMNLEQRTEYKNILRTYLDIEIKKVCEGKSLNFYHLISHGISRSLEFDELDPNFVRETWENIQSEMKDMDKNNFGSAVYYNRYSMHNT